MPFLIKHLDFLKKVLTLHFSTRFFINIFQNLSQNHLFYKNGTFIQKNIRMVTVKLYNSLMKIEICRNLFYQRKTLT